MKNIVHKKIIFFLILFCLFPTVGYAEKIEGLVERVVDGDTIIVQANSQKLRVRLYGIDCPEDGQLYGTLAKNLVSETLLNKYVVLDVLDVDRYGRLVALVMDNKGNKIQQILLENGLAWVYHKYCKLSYCNNWVDIEKKAKMKKIGLWKQSNPMAPWDWRKAR